MPRFGAGGSGGGGAHQRSRKYLFILGFVAFLGLFVVVDYLRASSNTKYVVVNDTSSVRQSFQIGDGGIVEDQDERVLELSATYADLQGEGPPLEWEEMSPCPVGRLDGYSTQIGNLFYVFAGYSTIDHVHTHVDIYNLSDNAWGGRFDMPKEMAHSHLGMVNDGRFVYIITGQYGPQCRPSTARSFVLDTKTNEWLDFPSLPVPRYAPPTTIWRGRLHVMGGGKEDRHEPSLQHWSIAVKDGRALEDGWRIELPIPRGGPHRACLVANDRLFIIGGQEGDFMAKYKSPIFKCVRRPEVVYGDVYMLEDLGSEWKQLPPMPKPNSHIETAWVMVNNSIIIVGGTTQPHPQTNKMILNGELFRFRLDTYEWSVLGRMPYRVKTTLAAFWDGWLYFSSGQRDKGPLDPSPKLVVGNTFRTKINI